MIMPVPKPPKSGAKVLSIAEFVGDKADPQTKTRRKGPPRASEAKVEAARAKMQEMAASGEWDGAAGMHLVVLYEMLHKDVYGIEPLEMDAKSRFLAAGVAGRLVEKFFAGDYGAAVSFMRWLWNREQEREIWRRANGRDGGRIGWRLQFSASLVSDYRVHGERNRG